MNGASPATGSAAGPDPVPGGWATRIVASSLLSLRHAALGLTMEPVRVCSGRAGLYRSMFKGRGIEFAESRLYQPGDEVRHMDWRVTARTGRPHTKIFHEDREQTVLVWVDLRPAMFFATRGLFKAVSAARGAALVAWKAALQGNRLGGLLFTDRLHREIRPMRGDHGVLHLIGLLAECAPSAEGSPPATEPDMEESLVRLRRVTRPGSRLFLFSDFPTLGEREKVHLAQLARRSDLTLMFFHDPLERMLPPPRSLSGDRRGADLSPGEPIHRQTPVLSGAISTPPGRVGTVLPPTGYSFSPLFHGRGCRTAVATKTRTPRSTRESPPWTIPPPPRLI